jgi:hypothetical protein
MLVSFKFEFCPLDGVTEEQVQDEFDDIAAEVTVELYDTPKRYFSVLCEDHRSAYHMVAFFNQVVGKLVSLADMSKEAVVVYSWLDDREYERADCQIYVVGLPHVRALTRIKRLQELRDACDTTITRLSGRAVTSPQGVLPLGWETAGEFEASLNLLERDAMEDYKPEEGSS